MLLPTFLISGVCLSKFSLVNYRREIIGVCLSDLKLVNDLESSIRGMFFQFDISEILGVYEDVGYVFLGVYLSLCRQLSFELQNVTLNFESKKHFYI